MKNIAINGRLVTGNTVQILVDGRALAVDANGNLITANNEQVRVQLQRDGQDIAGATNISTYVVQESDMGHRLTVRVTNTQGTQTITDDVTLSATRETVRTDLVDLNNDRLSDLVFINGNRLFSMTADAEKALPNEILSGSKGVLSTMSLQNADGSLAQLPNVDGTVISLDDALAQGRLQLIDTDFGQQQRMLFVDKATDSLVEVNPANGVATLLPASLYPENMSNVAQRQSQNLQLISSSIDDANNATPDALLWQREASNGVVELSINDKPLLDVNNQPLNLRVGATDWKVISTQDYTNDGRTDVLLEFKEAGQHHLYLLELDGSNKVVSQGYIGGGVNIPEGWNVVSTTKDIDGDSKLDLLFRNDVSGQLWKFALDGRDVIASTPVTGTETPMRYDLVDVADVDANGTADLIFRDTQAGDRLGETWIGLVNSDGSVSYQNLGAIPGWDVAAATLDINGDGRTELTYVNAVSGNIGIVELTPDARAIASAAPIGPYEGWSEISTVGVIHPEQMPTGFVDTMLL